MRRILLLTAILAMTILASAQVKEQPSGELRTYKRSGFAYMLDGGTPTKATQEGLVIDLVFDADGKTVWMKDVLAYMEYGTWVKASIEGNKLVLPMGQVLHHLNSINANLRLAVMDFDGDSYVADNSISEVTFTIDGDSFALDDMNEYHILSAYWDDDLSWVRVGDWLTVYSPFDEIPVVVPEGLETVSMPFFAYTSKKEIDDNLQLGFDNNDCYIKGICPFVPNGWVKGSLNGTTMTIPTGQYIGKYNNIPLYLCGSVE